MVRNQTRRTVWAAALWCVVGCSEPVTTAPNTSRIADIRAGQARLDARFDLVDGPRPRAPFTVLGPARFDRRGVQLGRFGLRVDSIGRGAEHQRLQPAGQMRSEKNRLSMLHDGGVEQWWLNGPLGLEHGFRLLAQPPETGEPLVVTLAVSSAIAEPDGNGGARLASLGRSFHYTDLFAEDADGVPLVSSMRALGDRIELTVDDHNARYPLLIDPLLWLEQGKLIASDAAVIDQLGFSVSADGDTALVGAPNDDDSGSQSGSAYVFVRERGAWTEQAKLTASDGAAFDGFGYAVALHADTAIIGAPNHDAAGNNAGAAYVFVRTATSWSEQAKLVASSTAASDELGGAVSVDGDSAIVGAIEAGAGGRAYVFVRTGTSWSEQALLESSDVASGDELGRAVDLSGDTGVIGAPFDDDGGSLSGSAYVFTRSGTSWSEQAKLTASDAASNDRFGSAVSVSADSAVVGSPNDDDAGSSSGSAYVYVRTGTSWSEQAKLTASDAALAAELGAAVSIAGDLALIGAPYAEPFGEQSGAAYVMQRNGSSWTELTKLIASDGAAFQNHGWSVAIADTTAIVGAPLDDGERGACYATLWAGTDGEACTSAGQCHSGFCVDGVCCEAACGDGAQDDCQACAASATGEPDGVCAPVTADAICRPANDACDVAEVCDGSARTCPVDAVAADGSACDDADACSEGDSCQGGVCRAGENICAMGSGGGGGSGGAAPPAATPSDSGDDGGCGCNTPGRRQRGLPLAAIALLAVALMSRRRRARRLAAAGVFAGRRV